MIRFECDYGEGAAQPVLDLLQKTNLEQTPGYGMDDYCDQARGLIRKLCDAPDAGVHFFVGATQANFTVVDALLKPWQGVLCADSGHINVHETGAVEATGHKCLALPSVQGKITAQQVRDAYDAHWADASHEHIAQPGMVYISNPTEDGTLSTKEELTAHIESRFAKFWLPDDYVFVPQIPRTSTGKFLKSKLRDEHGDLLLKSS